MSKLIEKKVDKFHNKIELITKKVNLWSASKLYDYGLSWQRNDVKANFRYWSDDEGETILLDVDYGGPDWLYLRNGDIVIRINDTKNIELKPSGEDIDVTSNEGHKIICREVLYYQVNKGDFIDICKATSIEFQISGSRSFVNGKAENLQAIARVLYDNLYEPIYDTKVLEEQLASKLKSILSCLFAFSASVICGFFFGLIVPFDGILNFITFGLPAVLFCVINLFLPYPKRIKWIPYVLLIIVGLITYAAQRGTIL